MSFSSESTNPPAAESPTRGARPLALSASRAADYRQCPLLYRLRTIDRIPEPKSRAQVLGTTVHSALEALYGLDQAQRTVDTAIHLAHTEADKSLAAGGIAADVVAADEAADFRSEAARMVRGLYVIEDPTRFNPHSCEDYLVTATTAGTPLHGYVDRIDIAPTGEVRVVDYKTGRFPRPGYADGPMAQMRFYAVMYFLLHAEVPTQLKLIYLKAGAELTLAPNQQMVQRTADELDELWQTIESDGTRGTFAPTQSRLCSWCNYQALCPAFGGTPPEYPGWPGTRQIPAPRS